MHQVIGLYTWSATMRNMGRYALISVTDKTGLAEFAAKLAYSHTLIASGGTASYLESHDLSVLHISDMTGFPEILDGRVKTLHPKIHGSILFKEGIMSHEEFVTLGLVNIDLVVCNLYQFDPSTDEPMETMDVGGTTMIRAAIKNYQRVSILVDPSDYEKYIGEVDHMSDKTRMELAYKALLHLNRHNTNITNYFRKSVSPGIEIPDDITFLTSYPQQLRYGENPHQRAYYVSTGERIFTKISGPEMSYNNFTDVSAGYFLVNEFDSPSCAIIKHRTPCGVASNQNLKDAYHNALQTDSTSAYGGVFCFNKLVDLELATELLKMFVDVLVAPEYSDDALELLRVKERMKILKMAPTVPSHDIAAVMGGYVIQEYDSHLVRHDDLEIVSEKQPSTEVMADLIFAWKVVKHIKSNAIVVTKEYQTLGIGSGQTSRVDAAKIAIERAGNDTRGAVMASDAFFPFPDSVQLAAKAGIHAIISVKGSIRDKEVIEEANKLGLILVFNRMRGFKH